MDYDITIIGGGPGGYVAAIKAAQMGKKTCIIEKSHFGGTCLNEGCIPTKALIKTVNMLEEIKRSADFGIEGIEADKVRVSMDKLQKRKAGVVKQLVGGVQGLLRANQVTVINGSASFLDENTVLAGDRKITSEYFIIATGSDSLMPAFIEYEGKTNIITSREALNLDSVPESAAIIGGGVIGIEFAYILSLLGVKVTVLELMNNILPMIDEEISGLARKKLEQHGVVFVTGAKVEKISGDDVIYEYLGERKSQKAEVVLMAIGRVPYTDGLQAETIGIEFNRKAIKVDEYLRTNIPNIYAIGDVNGTSMLAHTASHEGITAVGNITGQQEKMSYDFIPSCIYMEPEISAIGLTEKQAREKYENIRVGKFPMVANGKSLIEGDSSGLMKVIVDEDLGEILGVHIFAHHATDMISELSIAMNLEATAEEIIHAIHPHPTVSEGIPEAFMASVGKAIHAL
jgi:dihydrolipoamide dehydrogenase